MELRSRVFFLKKGIRPLDSPPDQDNQQICPMDFAKKRMVTDFSSRNPRGCTTKAFYYFPFYQKVLPNPPLEGLEAGKGRHAGE